MTETLAPPPPAGSRKTPDRPCLNCGDPTPGNFCRNCGQRKIEVRVSLRGMLMEALDDQFSLNSALPRTIGALFFRPGRLTRDYMDGRIARYIPPFRLYLISSLLFFLVLSFDLRLEGAADSLQIRADTSEVAVVPAAPPGAVAAPPAPRRSWIRNARASTGVAKLDTLITRRVRELGEMEPRAAIERLLDQFMQYAPQTMFVLVPAFAALLKLLYVRRRRLYVEHFVFALHLHAFVFLSIAITLIVPGVAIEALALVWTLVYGYLALHRVYGQGWFRTGIKYMVLGVSYWLILAVAFAITLGAAVLLM